MLATLIRIGISEKWKASKIRSRILVRVASHSECYIQISNVRGDKNITRTKEKTNCQRRYKSL